MNYLFYMGIIAPTVITIVLFVIFVYCWFLQKARKEVLTKKYDPHGKMKRMGIPMTSPPPPPYCRLDANHHLSARFVDNGEDNEAYDVSRSPSTEQEARGRPLYHTYHDSGISAGLSPSQENEPRPGMSYRSCPDSGISGFSVISHPPPPSQIACRGCYQAREQMPQMQQQNHQQQHHHSQQQQHPHHPAHQMQQLQHYSDQQHPQQLVLHHNTNTVQASVHPTHGVCYGDDTRHPQSPQHYNPPPIQSSSSTVAMNDSQQLVFVNGGRHFTTMPHIHEMPSSDIVIDDRVCYYANSPDHQSYDPNSTDPRQCCQEEMMDELIHEHPQHPQHQPPAYPSATFHPHPQTPRAMVLLSSPSDSPHAPPIPMSNHPKMTVNSQTTPAALAKQSDAQSPDIGNHVGYPHPHHSSPQKSKQLTSSSSASSPLHSQSQHPPRHSYRDSGVQDVGHASDVSHAQSHAHVHGGVSSDRPDSQASTSSTTDSEDSGFRSSRCAAAAQYKLNKQANPLLKPLRRPRNAKTRSKSTRAGDEEDPNVHGATPLSTLNPQNLQCQANQNSNSPHVIQTTSLLDDKRGGQRSPPRILQQQQSASKYTPSSIPEGSQGPNYQNDNSSGCHSSSPEANAKHLDMTEISTHLSWKYLHDLSVSSTSSQETYNGQEGLQLCHTNASRAPQFQAIPEPPLDTCGYSIV